MEQFRPGIPNGKPETGNGEPLKRQYICNLHWRSRFIIFQHDGPSRSIIGADLPLKGGRRITRRIALQLTLELRCMPYALHKARKVLVLDFMDRVCISEHACVHK